jgi:hypothetical protein
MIKFFDRDECTGDAGTGDIKYYERESTCDGTGGNTPT